MSFFGARVITMPRQEGLPGNWQATNSQRIVNGQPFGTGGKTGKLLRDSSLNSTIPELPGSGWLAAEPEATPQTHRLRPWGFPQVSPSYPSVFSPHGIQRITVEFSENSHYCWPAPEPLASSVDVRVPEARCPHKRRPTPAALVTVGLGWVGLSWITTINHRLSPRSHSPAAFNCQQPSTNANAMRMASPVPHARMG